jgi:(p)ppGpp synthase/HD superfamily hydrolase
VFDLAGTEEWLRENEIEAEDELILQRRISSDGKSTCRICGVPVSAVQMRELASLLVDIHGQNDGRQLMDERRHREYLDRFGSLDEQIREFGKEYRAYQALIKEKERLSMDEVEKERLSESLRYQIAELERAELKEGEKVVTGDNVARSAEEFVLDESKVAGLNVPMNDDVLIIDRNLKGIDYQLARCCTPIYGDSVFGFVTINGGIKIHRTDCPNAPELRRRYGYRIVKAKWSGKGSSQYSITLRIIGNDDIGIVNNLTSIISKDEKLVLRSINIDSHDGLFSGNLEVMIDDTSRLEALIKKLRAVKGVKQVDRI